MSKKQHLFECTLSFTYMADSPEDAVKQFLANIPLTDWYVHVKDTDTKKEYTVDTEDMTVETQG